jgi:hypothetical protein
MGKLAKSLLLVGLILLISGCQDQLTTPIKPKIDESLPVVEFESIKTIPDINAVALEWKAIDAAQAQGYYIIRADVQKGGKFQRVATVQNKYATHYLDKDLMANSKYAYKISMFTKDDMESRASSSVEVLTLPNLESVSFVQAISELPRQIKILWRPHSNPRVKKYILEKTTPVKSKWEKLTEIEDRFNVEYIDDKLGDNEIYLYRIMAETFDGIVSNPSQIVSATTKPLPLQISKLEATRDLPKKIQLSWGKSKTPDVVEYNIYRASSANGFFSKIAKAVESHNRFDDMIQEDGEIYFYKITTVDKDSLESDIKQVSPVMGSTLAKPNVPQITLSQIQGNKVILNWVSTDDRTVSYNIYKTTQESFISSKEKLIPNVQGLRFEDPDVVRGVEYNYTLQAVDAYGLLSEKTQEVSIKLPKLADGVRAD